MELRRSKRFDEKVRSAGELGDHGFFMVIWRHRHWQAGR